MRVVRMIGQAIMTVCILVIAIVAGSLAFSRFIQHDNPPNIFGYIPVTVLSGSMEPEISVGDVLLIKAQENYQINDVISYKDENMVVTHRIVSLTDQGFALKGDANNTIDSKYVKKEQIIGKLIMTIPLIGTIGLWLMTPAGIIGIIVIAGIIYFIKKRIEETKEAEV